MSPLILAAGWTLVHFVWQGVLIAIATGLVPEFLAFRSARLRYVVACLGLLAMLAAPVFTFGLAWVSTTPSPISEAANAFSASAERYEFRSLPALRAVPSRDPVLNVAFNPDSVMT